MKIGAVSGGGVPCKIPTEAERREYYIMMYQTMLNREVSFENRNAQAKKRIKHIMTAEKRMKALK